MTYDSPCRSIAVTGASGFIGRNLTAHLVSRGAGVVALKRPFEPASLARTMRGVDAVVHLAGLISAVDERDFTVANVDGTRAVATAARAADVRLVHISSLAAGGPAPAAAPRDENDPDAPLTPYGRSKLDGERAVKATEGLRWTILRPGVVYGPGDRAVLPLLRLAARGVLLQVGRRDAAFTFIHVSDVVQSIEAAVDARDDGDTLFVGHPRPVTVPRLLEALQAAVGRRAVVVRVPDALVRVGAWGGDLIGSLLRRPQLLNSARYAELCAEGFVCRVDRLRERLGVVAEIDLDRGLAQTAEWYRAAGWL